mgnify:CR=1 FL=1
MVAEDVLITGAGPIGCMATAICKILGARNVVVTDNNSFRLNLAKKMGADKTINITKEKIEDSFKDLRISNGFDIGLEMSGNPSALNDMIRTMYHGGKIALLGILPNDTLVKWNEIIFNAKCSFNPIIGEEYYLYKNKTMNFLSIIKPNEWKMEYIGTFKLDTKHTWQKVN